MGPGKDSRAALHMRHVNGAFKVMSPAGLENLASDAKAPALFATNAQRFARPARLRPFLIADC